MKLQMPATEEDAKLRIVLLETESSRMKIDHAELKRTVSEQGRVIDRLAQAAESRQAQRRGAFMAAGGIGAFLMWLASEVLAVLPWPR